MESRWFAMVVRLLLVTCVCFRTRFCGAAVSNADIVKDMLKTPGYNKDVRPGAGTVVYIDMFILSISSISEVNMDYTIMIYLRQTWKDHRLANKKLNGSTTLSHQTLQDMWVPDLFFKNSKKSTFHDITLPNRLIELQPDGSILYSQRLSLTLSCQMDLRHYPLDNQTCRIQFESYAYTTKDVIFEWRNVSEPVQQDPDLKLPEFRVTGRSVNNCTVAYITGAFTCLYAELYFKREYGYYLIQTFVPSGLIVILSWVSFWIDTRAVPARISLGLLTVLTITTHASGISSRLPPVSYIKAIDVWMSTCLIFVFGALIEFAAVNILDRKDMKKIEEEYISDSALSNVIKDRWLQATAMATGNVTFSRTGRAAYSRAATSTVSPAEVKLNGVSEQNENENTTVNGRIPQQRAKPPTGCAAFVARLKKNKPLFLDVISRIVFPSAFVVFNVFFWAYLYLP